MELVVAFGFFSLSLVVFHVVLLKILRVGRKFWVLSEYAIYAVGAVGAFVSIFALMIQAETNSVDTKIQNLKYEIDNVVDRLRSDKVASCLRGSEEQKCFAYSMALHIFDIWRLKHEFPLAGIPSCEDIRKHFESNDEIHGISIGYQKQWVAEHIGVEAIHPSCVSQDHYKRKDALGYDSSYVLDFNSIRDNIFHISELMPCYYRNCTVIVFRPYAIELERIDDLRNQISADYAAVKSRGRYASIFQWLGVFLICIAISLGITKTSAEYLDRT